MALLSGVLPAADDDEMYAGLLEGQRHLHSLGITSWQDAIVGAYAGMRDVGPTYARAAARGDLAQRGRRGAVVGARPRRGAGRRPRRQARRLVRRPVRADRGQGDAGRRRGERDRRARRALPRPVRPRDHQHRPLLRRPAGAARPRPRARPARASRCTSTGSATAACARRSTPSRAPTRRGGTTSPTSSSCTRPTSAAFGRARGRGQHPGAVGLPRRPDDRADDPVPRRGAGRSAVPLRRPAPRRRAAGRGQRLAGEHPRPARGDPRRGAPDGVRRTGAGRHRPVPARARRSTSRSPSRRTPAGRRG